MVLPSIKDRVYTIFFWIGKIYILFLCSFQGTFEFTPKGKVSEDEEYTGNTVTTNARGVLDLIAHSTIGTEENNPYLKLGSPHPVGFLAPGTYKRTSKTSEDFTNE